VLQRPLPRNRQVRARASSRLHHCCRPSSALLASVAFTYWLSALLTDAVGWGYAAVWVGNCARVGRRARQHEEREQQGERERNRTNRAFSTYELQWWVMYLNSRKIGVGGAPDAVLHEIHGFEACSIIFFGADPW
jgi:hypothetical protein